MNQDIAIIGMAVRFPEANTIPEFYDNLVSAKDCVTEVSAKRFCDSTFTMTEEQFQVMGLLDQIDRFDHRFFNITYREAYQMDPHQRITMEVAHEVLENAGHNPEELDGSNTAIVVTNSDYKYLKNFTELEPTMYSGNSQFSIAGRLSRFYNTKGPSFIVDTGCSSGLMALSLGCDQLHLGRSDQALVISAVLAMEPIPIELEVDLGISSTDGKTRTFNADSKGSGCSEAVVGVLIKPLEKAIADKDSVYAVVKSVAVNSSAQSSASLTATSSAAQAENMLEAWKRAGIDPETVGYIEAHGSGTKLGDPIEISGIDQAFRKFTERKHFCKVTSIKSNIGHTDKAAGLSGLAKAVLSLKHKQFFPALHFNKPNPLIDFANSVAVVNTELLPWEKTHDAPRRAGVNSFGFSGNNVHTLLEEAPEAEHSENESAPSGQFLVTMSSKRACGLRPNLEAQLAFLKKYPQPRISDVAFTLNQGRAHYRHRVALSATSTEDLCSKIEAILEKEIEPSSVSETLIQPLLIFSSDTSAPPDLITQLREQFSVFDQSYRQCEETLNSLSIEGTPGFRRFALQYSFYQLLDHLGLSSDKIIGVGVGDITVQAITGEIEFDEAVRTAAETTSEEALDLDERLTALIDSQTEFNRIAFIEIGTDGCLSQTLNRLPIPDRDELFQVFTLSPEAEDCLVDLFANLYLVDCPFNWEAFQSAYGGRRIHLPGYQFERIRCWYRPPHSHEEYLTWAERTMPPEQFERRRQELLNETEYTVSNGSTEIDSRWTATQQRVVNIWLDVLKVENIGLDDDFFELGGHSLFGTMMINRIEKEFQVQLTFKEILTQNTVRLMAKGIDDMIEGGGRLKSQEAIPVLPPQENYPASPVQQRLWVIDQKEGAMNFAYNITVALEISGPLVHEAIGEALRKVVDRHEALRTHFKEVNGELRQVIADSIDLEFGKIEATRDTLKETIYEFIQPFELNRGPLIRSVLLCIEANFNVLVVDIHHAAFDGSSMGPFLRDLSAAYQGADLPPLATTYKDYAAWKIGQLVSPEMMESEAYWLERFSELPSPLNLPIDFERPSIRSFEGGLVQTAYSLDLTQKIRDLAKANKATLFMTLLAGYNALLARYGDSEDIVVGSVTAGRTHQDLEEIVGMFVNTVALRNSPRKDLPFNEFLQSVKDNFLESYRHQDYPYEQLLQKLDHEFEPGRIPLFDTMMVLQNVDLSQTSLTRDIQLGATDMIRKSAKFDVTIEFYETPDGLFMNADYCTALFKHSTVERLAGDLRKVFEVITADPTLRLGDIPVDLATKTIEANAEDFSFGTL